MLFKILLEVCGLLLILLNSDGLRIDYENEARKADHMIVNHHHLLKTNEGYRNLTHAGVPQKKVIGVISAVSLGFTILKGIAERVDVSRTCVIGLANMGNRKLINPTWYMSWGKVRDPLPRFIMPGKAAVMTFEKSDYSLAGSAGVLTYTIDGTKDEIVVLWDVPFNYAGYSNEFNVQIRNHVTSNKALYVAMEQHDDKVTVSDSGHWLSNYNHGIAIHGAMTNSAKASLLIHVEFNLTTEYKSDLIFG